MAQKYQHIIKEKKISLMGTKRARGRRSQRRLLAVCVGTPESQVSALVAARSERHFLLFLRFTDRKPVESPTADVQCVVTKMCPVKCVCADVMSLRRNPRSLVLPSRRCFCTEDFVAALVVSCVW